MSALRKIAFDYDECVGATVLGNAIGNSIVDKQTSRELTPAQRRAKTSNGDYDNQNTTGSGGDFVPESLQGFDAGQLLNDKFGGDISAGPAPTFDIAKPLSNNPTNTIRAGSDATPDTKKTPPAPTNRVPRNGGGRNSVVGEIGDDLLSNMVKGAPVSSLEYLEFVSRTTEQTAVRQFVGTVAKEGQFLVDAAGNVMPGIRTTIQGETAELIGELKSAYSTVANKALNVASSAEEVLRTGVARVTDAGATAVEAIETTVRSATTPVLEAAGALGKTAKFLAGKAGGALLGAADTIVSNADYSNRQGINAAVAASVDTGAGAVIGATSVVAGNAAAVVTVGGVEFITGGGATPAAPFIYTGTSLVAGSTASALGSYAYKNFVRAPAISLTTSAVTNAYDAANSLIKYSKSP